MPLDEEATSSINERFEGDESELPVRRDEQPRRIPRQRAEGFHDPNVERTRSLLRIASRGISPRLSHGIHQPVGE